MVSLQNLSKLNGISMLITIFLFVVCSNHRKFQAHTMDRFAPIIDIFNSLTKQSISMIELRGTILDDIYGSRKHYSKRFVSLLHYIHSTRHKGDIHNISKKSKYCDVKKMLEICVNDIDDVLNKRDDEFLINQTETMMLADDIFCKFSVVNDIDRIEKTKVKATNVTAKVYSYHKSSSELVKFIETCQENYEDYLTKKLNQNMYYFVYDKIHEDEGMTYGFRKIKFESSKTFDNLFFQEKKALQKRLEFFENNKDVYDKLGIPHTFGILMHGEPGTGKTSTIKAIANCTKRHIIAIPLYKIKDISVLIKLFLNVDIDGVNVPFNKRIYVIEEIDCNGLKDIVQQRHNNVNKNANTNSNVLQKLMSSQEETFDDISPEQMKSILTLTTPSTSKNDNSKKSLTLGGILELLDGLIETPGRILIITTNHPEELDQALTRPGRIDMNIHFNRASCQDIASMYEMWYNEPIQHEEYNNIVEGVFSHAELCQLFFNNLSNPQHALVALTSTKKCVNHKKLNMD
jgi:ATP-dependent 26S proteasome regulatory subunit